MSQSVEAPYPAFADIDGQPLEDGYINIGAANLNPIYRYKFTEHFMEELYEFSKIHQYDARKDFKEAWKIWIYLRNITEWSVCMAPI